ncbi:MAG: 5'-methylthioadenosine/adenosylhomocysteine nucleosidase, partial [Clostridia bacterium]|nr:5'-methylthioadenosine/adenosylhomocysteine nucleosidase [Clostridia bacterium]
MKTVGILAPMELEYLPLLEKLQEAETCVLGGTRCTVGMLGKTRVILHECSVGKVNAALHTQLLIDTYHPDAILNVGIAGSLT